MKKLLIIALLVVVAIPVIGGFARWERKDKALRAVVLLLVLELLEAALYENESLIPRGIFHPGSGSTQLRLPDLFIPLALLGRLVAKRLPQRIGLPTVLWTAFAAWLTVELVEGYLRGNVHSQILYEAKAIIYVGGGFALAAGIPVRRYLESQVFERITLWFAPLIVVIDLLAASHKFYSVHLPLLPLDSFGAVGSDAATMFGAVGLIALVIELGKKRRSLWTIASTVPLLICAVLAGQRAALVGLGAAAAVVVLAGLGPIARKRLQVHPSEFVLGVVAVAALFLAIVLVPAALHQEAPKIPFSSTVNTAFNSISKEESAQDRVNEFAAARKMIPQHLILGWGLGVEYSYWAPGPNLEITSALTEDMYTDLLLRTGIVGLVLYALAVLCSLGDGLLAWRRHPDPMVALFALALLAGVVGLLVKGGFESDFENYRLATFLGLLLGMLRSTVTSAGSALPSIPTRTRSLLAGWNVNERV